MAIEKHEKPEKPKKKEVRIELSPRQTQAFDALDMGGVREVLYGGAKGGGKSVFGCVWCYQRALAIIEKHKLKPQRNPVQIGFMGRKQSVDFTGTTLETWKTFIPAECYRLKEQAKEIVIGNAVKIKYGGLDRSEDVQKFNSAEFAFAFIDQAEEVTRDDIAALRGSLRKKINGSAILPKLLMTANPRNCWLRDEFILSPSSEKVFIQALPSDNPHLPMWYVDQLKDAFKHRPELLEAYLHGSWGVFEGDDQVIRERWVREANSLILYPPDIRRLVVVDPARFGDDETVIYSLENTNIVDEAIFGQKSLMYTANKVFIRQRDFGASVVIVDGDGVGGGVADRLREMGVYVVEMRGAAKSPEPKQTVKYYNMRAFAWANTARAFAEGDIELHHDDPILAGQLCTPLYKFRNGKILIESKDDIKKRLGRSPDRADAYVMGHWGLQFTTTERKRNHKDVWAENDSALNAMAM